MKMSLDELKYPIGKFNWPKEITADGIKDCINTIKNFPDLLKTEVDKLKSEELAYIYRPEGWSIQQVVHHCADSHSNAFTRFKLTITEDKPTIKPYLENLWAQLPDVTEAPIEWSLSILNGLHNRWVLLLKNMTNGQWKRVFIHPEHRREITLESAVYLYAWHCNHHLAHVIQAKKFKDNFENL